MSTVGGQGIASGFRDAVSLAWRLAVLCRSQQNKPGFHQQVLKAWYEERKQQLEKSLSSTIENGRFVTEGNPFKIWIRNVYLWFVQLVPSWRHELSLGRRKEGLVRYEHSPGMPFLAEHNGGLCLPQVYCRSLQGSHTEVNFTDEIIFGQGKTGLFQLLVYLETVDEVASAREVVSNIGDLSQGLIRDDEVTFLVEDMAGASCKNDLDLFRLASGEEFAQSKLCENRPKPKFYDPFCLKKALDGRRYTIVRPDRFIFASCNSREDLSTIARAAAAYIQGSGAS
jgi:hypothetical protein